MITNINKKTGEVWSMKKIFYIVIWVAFIVILLFSNNIIALVNKNNIEKTNARIECFKKDQVYYATDNIDIINDIFDSFIIKGWAYCETNKENNNKSVSILLANDNQTYIKALTLTKRNDVRQVFQEKHRINGVYHGIQGTISTVGVKNGVYKVYIFCKENDENYGLVDTGMLLKKYGRGIIQYKWESTLTNITSTLEDIQTKNNLDSANITEEGYLQINGWAFIEGLDTADQSVYLRLTYDDGSIDIYDTQAVTRPDVGLAYKSDLYNNSGFKAVISADEVIDGDIKIEILIGRGENIYLASKAYTFSRGSIN